MMQRLPTFFSLLARLIAEFRTARRITKESLLKVILSRNVVESNELVHLITRIHRMFVVELKMAICSSIEAFYSFKV
jgi:hypothetical protein